MEKRVRHYKMPEAVAGNNDYFSRHIHMCTYKLLQRLLEKISVGNILILLDFTSFFVFSIDKLTNVQILVHF